MRNSITPTLALVYSILYLTTSATGFSQQTPTTPNIIFIFIDDLGWGDIGCYGNDFVDTPNIDQLAKSGIKFTDSYAAGAVCSPTRCAVQSGQNQARIGITSYIPGHWRPFERVITPVTAMALPHDIITVAESLKQSGYHTGYVGKWHLGWGAAFGPATQGYDDAMVIKGPHLPGKFYVKEREDITPPRPKQFRCDYESELCRDYIKRNRAKPFFLMVSPFAVHIPLASQSELVTKYRNRGKETGRDLPHPIYAALIEEVDTMVGEIVSEVQAQELTDHTMIVFTSDNGGLYRRYDYREHADDNVSNLAPLKGEKGSLHEGGIRVPLIITYPGVVTPGSTTSEPTISYDFYPTFVAAAGGQLPKHQTIDGESLLPILKDPTAKLNRSALHWHYPHYHHDRPASAIREGDWKLIEYIDGTGDIKLYNLANDLGETGNLIKSEPDKTQALKRKLTNWRTGAIARMPIHNPNHQPERAHEWWNIQTGSPVDSDSRKRFPQTELDLAD